MEKIHALILSLVFVGCSGPPVSHPHETAPQSVASVALASVAGDFSLLPAPQFLTAKQGRFVVSASTPIVLEGPSSPELQRVGAHLAALFSGAAGYSLRVSQKQVSNESAMNLTLDASVENVEGYRLSVDPDGVWLRASTPQGLFYGVQTLRQLLPPEIESAGLVEREWSLPAVEIEDAPRFAYRGMQLDVGRHFFSVQAVKKYIDMLAMFKFNTFHFHLTEDQGWRIEIKKYPKLTSVGAFRKETLKGHFSDVPHQYDGAPYGGFYTQEEIRDIVAYAGERHVEVIPEIELPGHSLAALAAYPKLACTSGPFETATTWGIFEDVYCPTQYTFEFLQNVLDEVVELFPSAMIHIGGDEVPKARWKASAEAQQLIKEHHLKDEDELQSYFVGRIAAYLKTKNRRIIGWDEILEGGLPPGATVMSWRGIAGGVQAAKEGHDVIMAPNTHTYFNRYQSTDFESEPPAGQGYLPLQTVYGFEPVAPGLTEIEARHILGAQGNLWSEYIRSEAHLDYMVHPRMEALAEVLWSPKEMRDWSSFSKRLPNALKRLHYLDVNFARHFLMVQQKSSIDAEGRMLVSLTSTTSAPIYYSTDGSDVTEQSSRYVSPFVLQGPSLVRTVSIENGVVQSPPVARKYWVHAALGAQVTYAHDYSPKYPAEDHTALTNGLRGSKMHGDGHWQGFEDAHLDVTVDFGKLITKSSVEVSFLDSPASWILPPREVSIFVSVDGESFESVASEKLVVETTPHAAKINFVKLNLHDRPFRYLRVFARKYGALPASHPGAGKAAWLFVDEILVQ